MRVRNTSNPRAVWATYIKNLRKATGLGRPELARRLGVDPSTVWRWETERQKPESPDVPKVLAELFHIDLDEVLAAAGLKPDTPVPAEPTRERDEEVELILSAPVSDRIKQRMLDRLEVLREQDKQRRINDIGFILDQADGGRRESA